jgi:TRAP-type C4-dicarboxylate transport system substrate-binding protein
MNKAKWNNLPSDIQNVIEKINEEWVEKTGSLWDQMDKDGKAYATGKGIKFITLSQEENALWAGKMKPIIDEYIQTMKGKNLPGEDALRFCEGYLAKNQK